MKYSNPKKKVKLQKAANGLHEVSVPPPGNAGDVMSSTLSGAATGASVGGVYGGIIGGVVGLGNGLVDMGTANAANSRARRRNAYVKANLAVDGVDPTLTQRAQYKEGTPAIASHKPIEVEKDELVFRKVGNTFSLKADFQKGKPHSKGGEEYLAQEGDIIFPGKQRGKVLEAYKSGNHSKLEGMRLKLPKDTNPQGEAALGVDNVDPRTGRYTDPYNKNGAYGQYQQALATGTYLNPYDPANLYPGDGVIAYQPQGQPKPSYYLNNQGMAPLSYLDSLKGGGGQSTPIPSSLATIPQQTSGSPTPTLEGPQEAGNAANWGNALKYASVANNLFQGLSSPEKVQESYLDPTLLSYTDRSEPLRRKSRIATTVQSSNARNTSGGNISNLRANQQIAQVEGFNRVQEIDNREQQRADQIQVANQQEVARVKGINSQKLDTYNALNGQARANKQAYLDSAFGQLSSLGNAQEQEGYMRARDKKMDDRDQAYLGYLNQTTHFTTDGKGGPVAWNPNGVGYLPTKSTDTQSTTTDSKGNTRTTTKRKLKRSI